MLIRRRVALDGGTPLLGATRPRRARRIISRHDGSLHMALSLSLRRRKASLERRFASMEARHCGSCHSERRRSLLARRSVVEYECAERFGGRDGAGVAERGDGSGRSAGASIGRSSAGGRTGGECLSSERALEAFRHTMSALRL